MTIEVSSRTLPVGGIDPFATGLDGFLKFAGFVAGQAPEGAVERGAAVRAALLGKAVDVTRRIMQLFRRQGFQFLDDQFQFAHGKKSLADFLIRGKGEALPAMHPNPPCTRPRACGRGWGRSSYRKLPSLSISGTAFLSTTAAGPSCDRHRTV